MFDLRSQSVPPYHQSQAFLALQQAGMVVLSLYLCDSDAKHEQPADGLPLFVSSLKRLLVYQVYVFSSMRTSSGQYQQ